MNMQDPKYQQKSIPLCSPEPNYLFIFAIRYPVLHQHIFDLFRPIHPPYQQRSAFFHSLLKHDVSISSYIFAFGLIKYEQMGLVFINKTCSVLFEQNSKTLLWSVTTQGTVPKLPQKPVIPSTHSDYKWLVPSTFQINRSLVCFQFNLQLDLQLNCQLK